MRTFCQWYSNLRVTLFSLFKKQYHYMSMLAGVKCQIQEQAVIKTPGNVNVSSKFVKQTAPKLAVVSTPFT